ncbi:hypothetical protein [Spirosoma aerolatum]|uniref:hypothetical protein n=1 Tax=Spirosoma aerolatum TaxID=1211326 RepID=UPI0012D33BDE|nr:hypothetical protein [Spirosoma aerolatum]
MRQSLLMMSSVLASLLGFMGYCWLLIDWYQDMKYGHYEREPLETIVESGVIIAYCYVAFRFIQPKVKNIQASANPAEDDLSTRTKSSSTGWLGRLMMPSTRARFEGEADLGSRPYQSK